MQITRSPTEFNGFELGPSAHCNGREALFAVSLVVSVQVFGALNLRGVGDSEFPAGEQLPRSCKMP